MALTRWLLILRMLILGIGVRLRGNRHPSQQKENKTRKLRRIEAPATNRHADLGTASIAVMGSKRVKTLCLVVAEFETVEQQRDVLRLLDDIIQRLKVGEVC